MVNSVNVLNVAIGIIFNPSGEVLIAQRPSDKSYSGLWEFPGGKIESNESVFEALKRELLEEIGITVIAANAWLETRYTYPDRTVLLNAWTVTQFTGEPTGKEGQRVQWVALNFLDQFHFLEANAGIVDKLTKNL